RLCVSVNDAGATLSIAHTYIPDEQLLQGTNGVHSVCTSKVVYHFSQKAVYHFSQKVVYHFSQKVVYHFCQKVVYHFS
ncbi:hypothetical protein SARC_17598, partial [Sphaeroforma arctica JP610]